MAALTFTPVGGAQAFNMQDIYASGVNSMLYQWGLIQFEVQPLNVHAADHETATDWAHKDIAGASIYREWVGENDEKLFISGRLFPYRIGGLSNLEVFEATRRAGTANMLIRGDGSVLGWFVCEKLVRQHTYLSGQGVGQQIAFEAHLARVPVPPSATYLSAMWNTVVASGG
jgi:uncharacterized protein